jgi:hypothetical protein
MDIQGTNQPESLPPSNVPSNGWYHDLLNRVVTAAGNQLELIKI